MSTSSLKESDPLKRVISTPLNKKPSYGLNQSDSLVSPSSSLMISSPLVKWETPHNYNLRAHHHQPGYTPRWSSTPLLSHNSNQPDIRAYSSPSLIPQEKQILDFEKRLEVLEDKEESDIDSGFESRLQEQEEVTGENVTEEVPDVPVELPARAPSPPTLGLVPKRRSPRFKQKPVTDRLRTSSRLNRKEEVTTSRSALTTVKRKFQGGRESLDFIHNFKEMNLDHVLEILYRHLSPSDLLRVVQVSRVWRLALESISAHNDRRLALISKMKPERENVGVDSQLQTRRTSPRRVMEEVANTRFKVSPTAAKRDRTRSSATLVSPSKVRHKLFVDEASKLKEGDSLSKCPICSSPSPSSRSPLRAVCSSPNCHFVFCPDCSCAEHPGKPCRTVRTSSKVSKSGGIASKKSKDRLRRL